MTTVYRDKCAWVDNRDEPDEAPCGQEAMRENWHRGNGYCREHAERLLGPQIDRVLKGMHGWSWLKAAFAGTTVIQAFLVKLPDGRERDKFVGIAVLKSRGHYAPALAAARNILAEVKYAAAAWLRGSLIDPYWSNLSESRRKGLQNQWVSLDGHLRNCAAASEEIVQARAALQSAGKAGRLLRDSSATAYVQAFALVRALSGVIEKAWKHGSDQTSPIVKAVYERVMGVELPEEGKEEGEAVPTNGAATALSSEVAAETTVEAVTNSDEPSEAPTPVAADNAPAEPTPDKAEVVIKPKRNWTRREGKKA